MKRNLQLTLLGVCCLSLAATAQIRLAPPSALRSDLQKIVAEFPSQFAGIRGEVVDRNPQSTEYRSRLVLNGAGQCSVVAYSSDVKPVYSWQAVLLETEDFEVAAKKYKWLYQQVQGANLYHVKDQYTLRGAYQEADESRGFALSTLSPVRPPDVYRKLRVDVSLQFEFPEWKVQLLVYEKEREDDEAGNETDGRQP